MITKCKIKVSSNLLLSICSKQPSTQPSKKPSKKPGKLDSQLSARVLLLTFLLCNLPQSWANSSNPYTVKKGDSLSSIAEQFGIDFSKIDELATLNNIKNKDLIYPGQEIYLDNFLLVKTAEADAAPSKDPVEITPPVSEPEQLPEESEAIPVEAVEEIVEHPPTEIEVASPSDEAIEAVSAEAKPKWKFDFKYDPGFELGFGIGQSQVDIGSGNFNVAGQNIDIDMEEQSLHLQLFLIMSLNESFGLEFALHQLGTYEFSGELSSSQNIGTTQGEQKYQALSLSAHYKNSFNFFDTRFSAGLMQIKQSTSGSIDILGNDPESLSNSENSSNLFLALEAHREIYKSWSIGPIFTWVDTGDPIQSLSLRLSRPLR